MLRIVLDTNNVLVSAVIANGKPRDLLAYATTSYAMLLVHWTLVGNDILK